MNHSEVAKVKYVIEILLRNNESYGLSYSKKKAHIKIYRVRHLQNSSYFVWALSMILLVLLIRYSLVSDKEYSNTLKIVRFQSITPWWC